MRHLFLLCCILLSAGALAQKYTFKNYTVEDGLAQSQINDINQDQKGYLWISTESGLSRFDGLSFRNYSVDDGLPDNKVEKIYFFDDECWVGTPNGLAKFDGDGFIPYLFEETERINDILYFNGKIHAATNSGLLILEGEQFSKLAFDENEPLVIRSIRNYNDQFLLCGTRTGLFKYDGAFKAVENSKLMELNISDIELLGQDLYISTYGDGLLCYNIEDGSEKTIAVDINRIRSIYVDEQVILCSSVRGGAEITASETTYFRSSNGLVNESVVCMFKDREDNIWIGTDGNGLLKFLGKSVISYSSSDGLSSDIVMSIHQNSDSSFLFGTYNQGITVFKNGQMSSISQSNGLKDNTVWKIASLTDGISNWVATSKGINKLQNGNITVSPQTDSITSKIRTIAIQDEGTAFFGGTDGVFYQNDIGIKPIQSLSNFNVNDLKIHEDTLFVACQEGLFQTPINDGMVQLAQIELPEENVNCIIIDRRGILWIGTMNGLFVRLESGEIVPFPLDEDDFNSKTTLGILEAKNGDIWVSTMSGIYQISPKKDIGYSYSLYHYSTAEGLINLEANQNAIYEDLESNIWIGTASGLAKIDPSYQNELFSSVAPELHITGIRLFMEEFDYGRFDSEFIDGSDVPSSISLPYDQNHITFDFIGINLKNPTSVLYEYRLLGSNSSWSPLSKTNYATYSDLSPGEYDFEVRATNKNYNWSETKGLHIIIHSPFWYTWWFISLMIIAIMMILIAIFQARIRSIKQKQENEKLSYKNRLLFLEQQSLNASMNRHFIFNSLNSIQYFINSSDKISANKYLSSFAKLIRKNLDSSTSNNFIVTLQEEIERIELYLTLEKMRFQEKFDYELKVSSSLDTESIEIPSMILQPFVENSIIHGVLPLEQKGHIQINIFEELGEVVFEVIDDGIGIETTLKKKKDSIAGDHESKGMEITNRRIELLRKLTGDNLLIIGPFQLNDTNGDCIGTKVVIKMGVNIEQ